MMSELSMHLAFVYSILSLLSINVRGVVSDFGLD